MESGTHAPDTLGSNWLLAFLKLTENRHAITWPFGLASGRRRAERFAPAAELAWAVHHHTEPRAASQRSRISEEGGANESVRTPVPFTASLRRGYPGDLEIGQERNIAVGWQLLQEHAAVPCAPPLMRLWGQAIEYLGYPLLALPSGAGHDAVVLSALTAISMLFVRCRGGISHNPAEAVLSEDVAVAIKVAEQFLRLLAKDGRLEF